MPSREERLEGALIGLLVGDALGVPYEFKPASALPALDEIEMQPPSWFARTYDGLPIGTWSDDGAQALCLLASLFECGRLDLVDFASRLVRWRAEGYMAVGAHVFDVGIQTRRALDALEAGVPVTEAAPRGERTNGNGSLMRVLPLALWHRGSDVELVRDARRSSIVTHPELRSELCCALYCLWVRGVLEERGEPYVTAVEGLRALVADEPAALAELDEAIVPLSAPERPGSGYVVDTLRAARAVMVRGSFEAVVKAAIAFGDDTDTTAAVAGGVAGARDGLAAIPARWRSTLRGGELLEPMIERLRAR